FSKQEENLRKNLNDDMRNILSSFFQNKPSTLGTLPSNTILNPKGEMKAMTTRSGLAYEDVTCEDFVQDILDFQYNPKSSNPTLVYDDLISESDFYPCSLLPMDLKLAEQLKEKSSIEEPPELELKELPSHLEYAFLEDSNKLPIIIAKNLKVDEKEALLNVLKSYKRVIAWKISDIKCIDPRFCTHKILMKDDYKPTVQSQRRVNPKIHDVIEKEVIKPLDVGMIYPFQRGLLPVGEYA
nr:reverse transcriptase domain-containing protein [Tanacetum cinerariifolium]